MSIRRGDVVSHANAIEWGVGKVIDVSDYRASIHFNDGITRKIACSHFASLVPAAPGTYVPISAPVEPAAAKVPRRKTTAKRAASSE